MSELLLRGLPHCSVYKKDLQTAYTEILKILGRKKFNRKLLQLYEFHSIELS